METTHQKAKSIFSDVKWPLRPMVLFSPFNTVGRCALLGADPRVPKCVFNPLLRACDTPRLESASTRDLLQDLFQREGFELLGL